MPSPAPAVLVDRVVRTYGNLRAVDGASLQVARGTLCALLGPNGAGKTTLAECVAGFRRPDQGSVRVLGLDPVADRGRVSEVLGVLLQEGGVYPAATPREMIRLVVRLHGVGPSADDLLARVGLQAAADRRYRRLSGGQKQRLHLAMALAGRPRVLVLDEPTSAVDATGRAVIWDTLRDLRDEGTAVLFTTHDLREAERLADRVVVIDHGRVVADDTPSRLAAAEAPPGLLVTTAEPVPAAELQAALGMHVRADGHGRLVVDAGPDAIARVSNVCAAKGWSLRGVATLDPDLEQVVARLVDERTPVGSHPATAARTPATGRTR